MELSKKKSVLVGILGALIAGLCCFSPLALFLLGLASASLAGSLANTLYYQYKWVFRAAGIIFLALFFFLWYRKKAKTCPIDQRAFLQRKILNLFLLSIPIFVAAYIVWLYGVVEYLGIKLHLWEVPRSILWKALF